MHKLELKLIMSLGKWYNGQYHTCDFNYVLSKDLAKQLYIIGSWDEWTDYKPFEIYSDHDGKIKWTIHLSDIYPWYEYKLVYEDHEGTRHWFNYLKDDKTPVEHILKNNYIDKKWFDNTVDVNYGKAPHSNMHYRYYTHANPAGLDMNDMNIDIDLNDNPYDTPDNYDFSVFEYPMGEVNLVSGNWHYGPLPTINNIQQSDNGNNEHPEDIADMTDMADMADILDCTKYERVYLFQEGCPDEEEWIFVVKHQNGNFVFFCAGCDNSGFGCQGGGTIYYDKDGKKMWKYGFDDSLRYKFLLSKLATVINDS